MKLQAPFSISAGLYPAIRIGNATLECREALQFAIVFDGKAKDYLLKAFRPGACADFQSCFSAILSFLSAWGEALEFQDRTGLDSENADLFPVNNKALRNWVLENYDLLCMLSCEIDESENLIEGA